MTAIPDTVTRPVRIHADRAAGTLELEWADGHQTTYDFDHAPLAVPVRVLPRRGRHAGLARQRPDAHRRADPPDRHRLVGQYAVAPTWGDGHHTGYYTFQMLREHCPCPDDTALGGGVATGRPSGHLAHESQGGVTMIVATTPVHRRPPDRRDKGMDFGLVVRSRGFGGNIMAGLRSIGGGEIKEYTELLEDTRRQAIDRLVKNATLMGANAVISMRFDSSELAGTMSEIVAYGTAVVVEPDAAPTTADRVSDGPGRRAGSSSRRSARRCSSFGLASASPVLDGGEPRPGWA